MPAITLHILAWLLVLLIGCTSSGEEKTPAANDGDLDTLTLGVVSWNATQGYLDTEGKPIILGGVAFGNEVWSALNPSKQHHGEEDFLRLRAMGLVAIRFYLSYHFFENDEAPFQYKQSGWDWLDSNVAWANRHGVYLILNMHVPQGGFQSLGEGAALWDEVQNQDRLTALWHAIAMRYARQRAIAAYDLLNEPMVTRDKSQWQSLAQRILDTIRTADTSHLVFVERMNGIIGGAWSNDEEMNFVDVHDPYGRTGLTYHFYAPFEFTHQYASWTPLAKQDGGSYPDSTRLQIMGSNWKTATFDNESAPAGNSDWTRYTGKWYTVDDTSYVNLARPTLVCHSIGSGAVRFDSIQVDEMTKDGSVKALALYDLPTDGSWNFWTAKPGGKAINNKDSTYVAITGTLDDANFASADMYMHVQQGFSYRVQGKMQGINVPSKARCLVRLDLEHAKQVQYRDKAYLSSEIDAYDAIAKKKGLPSYLGEFGTIRYTMTEEKGGLRWVSDMLDILQERNLSFTFHSWHEDNFGVYYGYGSIPIDPNNANQALIDLFTRRFSTP